MFCIRMGRGHAHLVPCNTPAGVGCTTDTKKKVHGEKDTKGRGLHILNLLNLYISFFVAMDLYTHNEFWATNDFVDPVHPRIAEEFGYCRCGVSFSFNDMTNFSNLFSAKCPDPSHQTHLRGELRLAQFLTLSLPITSTILLINLSVDRPNKVW